MEFDERTSWKSWALNNPKRTSGYHGINRASENNLNDDSGLRTNTSQSYDFKLSYSYNVMQNLSLLS